MTTEKILIENLPITKEFLREKRLIQERGELALIEDGKSFQHLGYFSLLPGNGFYRGGHYHRTKTEKFYVINGKIKITLFDLETGTKDFVEVQDGDRVSIFPDCAHRFEAVEDAQVIEYYDCAYDPEDDFPFFDY